MKQNTTKAKPTGRRKKSEVDVLKPAAEQLYLMGKTLAEVAAITGVDVKTLGKWSEEKGWAAHRAVITISKPQLLKSLYGQCKALTDAIEARPEKERYANSKEADSLLKLTAAIKNLEGEANISQVIEVGITMTDWTANFKPEHTETITNLFTDFLNSRLQHAAK